MVVAARALDRESLNYSSKQGYHSVPLVTEGSPTTTASLQQSQTTRQRVYPQCGRIHRPTLWGGPLPAHLSPLLVAPSGFCVEECAGFSPRLGVWGWGWERWLTTRWNSVQRQFGPLMCCWFFFYSRMNFFFFLKSQIKNKLCALMRVLLGLQLLELLLSDWGGEMEPATSALGEERRVWAKRTLPIAGGMWSRARECEFKGIRCHQFTFPS